jgi:hypothetical protein
MTAPRRLAAPAARSSLLSQTVVAKAAAAAAPEAATEAVAYLRFIRGSPLKVRSEQRGGARFWGQCPSILN